MRIKIISCKNSLLWYSQYIGKEFDVIRQDNFYWVYEPDDMFRLTNIVHKEDAEILLKESV